MVFYHVLAWGLAVILYVIAVGLHKSRRTKALKLIKMNLRLLEVVIIITGTILMLSIYNLNLMYILKSVVGIWVIALMEMILSRMGKGKDTSILWAQFVFAFILVLYMGFKLPLGFKLF